jgi:integrase/recombinase XerC
MSASHASPDVAAEITRWIGHLGAERRMSPKTLEAYRRDVSQFLAFLADHLGGAPTLKQLAKLAPADVRAFMAARRSEGIGNRSLMRALAGTRSFARFLERNGKGTVAALTAIRSPKLPKSLPKPLAVSAARQMTETSLREGETREPWVIARDRQGQQNPHGTGPAPGC